jgi:DNA-binding MurR/RpiR family transcriptional regulator
VPRSISDDKVEEIVVKTLEQMPADATHWSTHSLAKAVGVSPASVGRIWAAFGLQPWRSESFKLSIGLKGAIIGVAVHAATW